MFFKPTEIPALVLGSMLGKMFKSGGSKSFEFDHDNEPESVWFAIQFYSAKYRNKAIESEAVKNLIPYFSNKLRYNFLKWFEPRLSRINPYEKNEIDLLLYDINIEFSKLIGNRFSVHNFSNRYPLTFKGLENAYNDLCSEIVNTYKTRYNDRMVNAGFEPDGSKVDYETAFSSL